MSEFVSIPVRFNGSPIPAVSDVQVVSTRNVQQNSTTDGTKLTFGRPKFSASITFKTLEDRMRYLRLSGAFQDKPPPHRLGFDVGGASFTLLECIPNNTTISGDQDASAQLVQQVMAESFQDEGDN